MPPTLVSDLPTKERVARSFEVKDHAIEAMKVIPDDFILVHCLGRWCFDVANINWIERKIAQALFSKPPERQFYK
jgi:hypothetical protein